MADDESLWKSFDCCREKDIGLWSSFSSNVNLFLLIETNMKKIKNFVTFVFSLTQTFQVNFSIFFFRRRENSN